jgi:DMSO reductase anchor subunit
MHPAPSIVFFTTASGAGYGLLLLLGLLVPAGLIPADRWLGVVALGLSLGLVTLGLISSTFHLGHPERAWRALSQWRSSWLSREGVMALLTYGPAGLFGYGWIVLERSDGLWALSAVLASVGALLTVISTAMIYASLKPIRQWHDPKVVVVYLAFAVTTGALWLNATLHLFGRASGWSDALMVGSPWVAWAVKFVTWRSIDGTGGASTPETATGLGAQGQVRLLDPPHTESNYLLREMAFRIARKHARKLRGLAVISGLLTPSLLGAVAMLAGGWLATVAVLLAAACGTAGVIVERWLFFAEAKHTVTLYYGARTA